MRKVVIVQNVLTEFRVPFFTELRSTLAERDIHLELLYDLPRGADALKQNTVSLEWSRRQANHVFGYRTRHLIWQPVLSDLEMADLVIVEQASRLLINYVLLLKQNGRKWPKVALWGHGRNLNTDQASWTGEFLKRKYSTRAHWWFAYTDGVAKYIESLGYPEERITVVQNALDTAMRRKEISAVESEDLSNFRRRFDAQEGKTCLFIGSLYKEKRLEFLIDAAVEIGRLVPGFRLLIAGDGVDRHVAREAASIHSEIVWLGRLDGTERALALRAADLVLMPGLVGLAILDAFAAEAPIITTAVPFHSPEIEYLQDGVNGVRLENSGDVVGYAQTVFRLLTSPGELERLRLGCRSSASRYTNEAMVARTSDGIEAALDAPLQHQPSA